MSVCIGTESAVDLTLGGSKTLWTVNDSSIWIIIITIQNSRCVHDCVFIILLLIFLTGMLTVWCETDNFEFLSFSDLTNNATHLYGPPIINRRDYDLLNMTSGHILFPCMKFTCSGRISRLRFMTSPELVFSTILQWPRFSLCLDRNNCIQLHFDQQPTLHDMNTNRAIYEAVVSQEVSFDSGYFLRISYPSSCRNTRNFNNISESVCRRQHVFYQTFGGYCNAIVISGARTYHPGPILPYIAIQTG